MLFNSHIKKENIESAIRISFGDFNDINDCDALIEGIKKIV